MKFFSRIGKLIERGRLAKSVSVQLRWARRRVRRFFLRENVREGLRGRFARRVYVSAALLNAVAAVVILSGACASRFLADEQVLVRRLSDPDFDRSNPILCALDSIGSSNRIQVTLRTEDADLLHGVRTDLNRGRLNLVLTLTDGRRMEYTLRNRRMDILESGNTDQFTLILPDTVSVFDLASCKLQLLPDAKGVYGSWTCRWAQVSFLLGGERTLFARDHWSEPVRFSAELPAAELDIVSVENPYFNQIRELFPRILSVCQNGRETVHDAAMKENALRALGVSGEGTLYLDVETVGVERMNRLLREQMGIRPDIDEDAVSDALDQDTVEELNYDSRMYLRLRFYAGSAGEYVKEYLLDTPGKDDFEPGGSSTFEIPMPEGLCAFDIRSAELVVRNNRDAWAPRMLRLYLRTAYGTQLELSRLTDVSLTESRGTCIFYRGWLDTSVSPVSFDLSRRVSLPAALKDEVEKTYGVQIAGVTYSMYFSDFDFYERQVLFYSQLQALYGAVITDA